MSCALGLSVTAPAQSDSSGLHLLQNVEVLRLPGVEIDSFLTLAEAERAAVASSPVIRELEARIKAARCACVQARLPPNPTAGYVASEVGNEGQAGQQGAFVGQQFLRGGKLTYAQAVAAKEARRLEQVLAVERLRLLTSVRTGMLNVSLAQREVELARKLVEVSKDAVETSQQLVEAGEGRKSEVLQAQIEQRRAAVRLRQAETKLTSQWRGLAALLMSQDETPPLIDFDSERLLHHASWEETRRRVLAASPQIAQQVAAIEKARCEVAYQRSLAVSDINAQFSVQYDDATGDTVTGVQIGMPIRFWNRNQGGVGQAASNLTASKRRLEAVEQSLSRRLAKTYGSYQTARLQVEAIQQDLLPAAEENLDLSAASYRAGESTYIEMLTAQRTLFQVSLEYLASLGRLNATSQLLEGCLLAEDSINPEE